MSFWSFLQRFSSVCPITLRDIDSNPGSAFPSLPDDKAEENGGSFVFDDSLPVLKLNGSHRDIGLQEGSLLRTQIRSFLQHYLHSSLGRNRKRWKQIQCRANSCREFIPDRYLNEYEGLAEATGLDPDVFLSGSVFLDFYSTVLCSCIAITKEHSRFDQLLVGRNLDFPSMGAAHRLTLFKLVNPDRYYRHMHLTWPGLTGVLTGINEHGLTLALSEVDGARPFGNGFPYTLLHRCLLEECRTIEQAGHLLRSVPRTRSNNLLVADESGRAAVFEYDRTDVVRREPQEGWVYATNHFVSGSLPNQPISLKYFSAARRYRKIKHAHRKKRNLSGKELFQLLQTLAMGRLNLASMVMYPGEQKIDARIGAPPAANRRTKTTSLTAGYKEKSKPVDRVETVT